jgi:hypothetical protein
MHRDKDDLTCKEKTVAVRERGSSPSPKQMRRVKHANKWRMLPPAVCVQGDRRHSSISVLSNQCVQLSHAIEQRRRERADWVYAYAYVIFQCFISYADLITDVALVVTLLGTAQAEYAYT